MVRSLEVVLCNHDVFEIRTDWTPLNKNVDTMDPPRLTVDPWKEKGAKKVRKSVSSLLKRLRLGSAELDSAFNSLHYWSTMPGYFFQGGSSDVKVSASCNCSRCSSKQVNEAWENTASKRSPSELPPSKKVMLGYYSVKKEGYKHNKLYRIFKKPNDIDISKAKDVTSSEHCRYYGVNVIPFMSIQPRPMLRNY